MLPVVAAVSSQCQCDFGPGVVVVLALYRIDVRCGVFGISALYRVVVAMQQCCTATTAMVSVKKACCILLPNVAVASATTLRAADLFVVNTLQSGGVEFNYLLLFELFKIVCGYLTFGTGLVIVKSKATHPEVSGSLTTNGSKNQRRMS